MHKRGKFTRQSSKRVVLSPRNDGFTPRGRPVRATARRQHRILGLGCELRVRAQRIEAARRWKRGPGVRFPILRRERKHLRGFRQGVIKCLGCGYHAGHVGEGHAVN